MDFDKINEELKQQFPELYAMNEMAMLDGGIILRNDGDNAKFSHFHWHNVHFNLFNRIPKNVTELRNRIHFESEKNLLSDNELTELFNLLYKRSNKKAGKYFQTVHDFAVAQWELLNDRDVDEEY